MLTNVQFLYIWIFVYLKLTPPSYFEVQYLILLKILIIVVNLTNGLSAFLRTSGNNEQRGEASFP